MLVKSHMFNPTKCHLCKIWDTQQAPLAASLNPGGSLYAVSMDSCGTRQIYHRKP